MTYDNIKIQKKKNKKNKKLVELVLVKCNLIES